MLPLILILPLLAAAICLVLNRRVASRWLGAAAAASLLVAALLLLAARLRGELPLVLLDHDWLVIAGEPIRLLLRFDANGWPLALLALLGGAGALAALAAALPGDLRGFGGLLAALLLAPLATVTGIANGEPLLLPFAWTAAALAGFVALRSSGALTDSDAPLTALTVGLVGALLAFTAAVAGRAADPGSAPLGVALVAAGGLAVLALGAPPLHAAVGSAAEAPAALAASFVALGLPLLGGYALLDFAASLGPIAGDGWRAALLALGALALLAGAAGAARATRMRRIVCWQLSAQSGAVLIAAGLGDRALAAAAPALLANTALTTLAAFLALAVLERRAGTDDLTALGGHGPFLLPGLALLVAGASAVGVPGTLGFWGKLWLVDELLRGAPWVTPLLLAGSALLALSYVAPVAAFWRRAGASEAEPGGGAQLLPSALAATVALALLVAGAAPGLLWRYWLMDATAILTPDVAPQAPPLPEGAAQIATTLAALALLGFPLLARGGARRRQTDAAMEAAGAIPPTALGHSLRGLAWAAAPDSALARVWEATQQLSRGAGTLLALFERRYYLAGLLIAMIVVILIFI
jgi:formate hydrogenlyase subunit 3/multisubunit Na+/H+ antiporter MnhD subunit